MSRYLIYANLILEIEAEDEKKAKDESIKKFKKLEEEGYKVEGARVADKKSGFFVS